jgi:hypothetical protein
MRICTTRSTPSLLAAGLAVSNDSGPRAAAHKQRQEPAPPLGDHRLAAAIATAIATAIAAAIANAIAAEGIGIGQRTGAWPRRPGREQAAETAPGSADADPQGGAVHRRWGGDGWKSPPPLPSPHPSPPMAGGHGGRAPIPASSSRSGRRASIAACPGLASSSMVCSFSVGGIGAGGFSAGGFSAGGFSAGGFSAGGISPQRR